jgi:hypothetical protein
MNLFPRNRRYRADGDDAVDERGYHQIANKGLFVRQKAMAFRRSARGGPVPDQAPGRRSIYNAGL